MSNFKFCPECGFKFDKEYKFCPECGYKLGGSVTEEKPLFDFSDDTQDYDDYKGFADMVKAKQGSQIDAEPLRRATVLCLRGEFEEAEKLTQAYIDKYYDNVEGYITLLRVHSKDFSEFEGEQIEKDIKIITKLGKGGVDDDDYKDYLKAREDYLADKKVKEEQAKKREEEKKKAAEEKRKAEEEKRKLEEEKKRVEEENRKAEEKKKEQKQKEEKTAKSSKTKATNTVQNVTLTPNETKELQAAIKKMDKYWGIGGTQKQKAYEVLKKYAERGVAEAQYKIILNWQLQDSHRVKWLEKAAKQGHVEAQLALGRCYYYGWGTKTDLQKALELLNECAPKAKDSFVLALTYESLGQYDEAIKWYKQNLEWNSKSTFSWFCMGRTYEHKKDYAKALECYNHCPKTDKETKEAIERVRKLI